VKERLMLFGISILMAITFLSCSQQQQHKDEDDIRVAPMEDGKSVGITRYTGTKQVFRIPQRFDVFPITAIGDTTFANKELISVTIPDTITSIGNGAFANYLLINAAIGSSVGTIGDGVDLEDNWQSDAFDRNFVYLYLRNNKRGGTYTRPNSTSSNWTRQP